MTLKPGPVRRVRPGAGRLTPVLRRRKGSPDHNDLPDGVDDADDADDAVDEPVGEAVGPADGVDGSHEGDEDYGADGGPGMLARPSMEHLSDARLLFDCGAWSRDDRAALDAALGASSIDRVWQGPELVVGLLDEHLVEEAFDDLGVGQADLSAATDQVVYEVGEWPRVLRDSLAESLLVAGIAAGWDDLADLHIAATDEATVDAIVEAMPDPDEVFEEAEGTEVQDLLTQLYAAVDRLKDNPKIPGARLDVIEAADRMDRLAVPFGFDAAQWRDLVERAGDLRDEIDRTTSAPADDEAGAGAVAAADEPDVATVAADEATAGDAAAVDEAPDDEPSDDETERLEAERAAFAARAAQLRDRLVRLV